MRLTTTPISTAAATTQDPTAALDSRAALPGRTEALPPSPDRRLALVAARSAGSITEASRAAFRTAASRVSAAGSTGAAVDFTGAAVDSTGAEVDSTGAAVDFTEVGDDSTHGSRAADVVTSRFSN